MHNFHNTPPLLKMIKIAQKIMVFNHFALVVFLVVLWQAAMAVQDDMSIILEQDIIVNSAKNCTFAAPKDK